ncbi:hypothetical protein NDU88_003654 [Pleurodeles waltl]|uniref:Uncharacterized protein n=1 Tax=Pleurodeles waltl TaxID=8319 RepID=A0AAV7MR67_PLEWA|nr:hypothetical protein NDU88_003654 [Pleurodeles waltl]
MEPGFVEQALVLLHRARRMDLVNQEALRALHPARRAAQGVVATVLACSPPSSPAQGIQVRIPGRVVGRGRGREKVSVAGCTAIKAAGLRRRVAGGNSTRPEGQGWGRKGPQLKEEGKKGAHYGGPSL